MNPREFFAIFYDHYVKFVYWWELHSLLSLVITFFVASLGRKVIFFILNPMVLFYNFKWTLLKVCFMIRTSLTSFVHNLFFSVFRCDIVLFFFYFESNSIFCNFMQPLLEYLFIDKSLTRFARSYHFRIHAITARRCDSFDERYPSKHCRRQLPWKKITRRRNIDVIST